jgi:hypothetical protein
MYMLTTAHDPIPPDFVFDFPQFNYQHATLLCSLCKTHPSSLITPLYLCGYPRCQQAFHPECTRRRGTHKLFDLDRQINQQPALYCPRHQLALKLDTEKAERTERCLHVAEFSRNLDLCFEIVKRKQDKAIKNSIGGSEFNRIYQE